MEKNKKSKLVWVLIIAFILTPLITSVASTIHVINFFQLSNGFGLALTLAMAFEIGALSALAGLVALDKINKNVVWFIFLILTVFQIMGNVYFAYDYLSVKMINNPELIKNWTELFGLMDEDQILVKRIIAIFSGGLLPVVSLAFLDLLVDYIRKTFGITENTDEKKTEPIIEESIVTEPIVINEPIIEVEKPSEEPQYAKEDFQKVLNDKKKNLEDIRQPFLELLNIFYKGGEIKEGEELPSYNNFLNQISDPSVTEQSIKLFLTYCNYLEIFKVSNTQKIALKNYEDAKAKLDEYLRWGDEKTGN